MIPTDTTLIKRTSPQSIDAVCSRVEGVCSKHDFGLIGEIDLQEKMQSKGIEFETPCRIFEVCNPQSAANVLCENMDIATSLPCRIAIYLDRAKNQTVISTVKPTKLVDMYDSSEAKEEAKEIETTMTSIVESLAS